ncbi:T9SS type A sorting domain-containing protein [Gelidibacter salicanalis]|uniref:T9SS type A sorting domain-containing protein n=1 Tax=Gelidibacter salicanalis TaxID=291193 RepID=A0A934NIS4_9FLAO|nr:T9SS type A sorting domain-containing protein [Gelidibacter salicanalis]MBJ7880424.1 T9SS type A sorting domain-containing protein [Gelidibacter salicanalis]
MKTFIVTLTFFLCSISIYAQDKLTFKYDTAGNQITRERICLNCNPLSRSATTESDSLGIADNDLKTVTEFQLKSYPNPVVDELYVEWVNNPEMLVAKIQLFSISSQLLYDMNVNDRQGEQQINFSNFPAGIYNVVIHYTNHSKKTFKIIKK